jgi:flagella basal body P-ring formation protein FlgA
MRGLLFPFGLFALLGDPASSATLRPETTLSSPQVLLSDLFEGAGPDASRVLGRAPPLGGRVVVEAPQLAAIARQFGVDWRPASSADRAILDRPGRPLPREQVVDTLRASLVAAGAPSEFDLELPGFVPPIVPLAGSAEPLVTQLDYDAVSGRFAAMLVVTAPGADPVHARLVGRVQETEEVPVAATKLPAGAALRPVDLRTGRVRTALIRAEIARDPAQAIGMVLRHPVAPGQPLPLADLGRPALVQKGALVHIVLNTASLTVAAQGEALEPAAMGEHVRVLNPISRAVLDAEVIGPDQVRVRPENAPLVAPARTRLALSP